jgi:hypothetical protein
MNTGAVGSLSIESAQSEGGENGPVGKIFSHFRSIGNENGKFRNEISSDKIRSIQNE